MVVVYEGEGGAYLWVVWEHSPVAPWPHHWGHSSWEECPAVSGWLAAWSSCWVREFMPHSIYIEAHYNLCNWNYVTLSRGKWTMWHFNLRRGQYHTWTHGHNDIHNYKWMTALYLLFSKYITIGNGVEQRVGNLASCTSHTDLEGSCLQHASHAGEHSAVWCHTIHAFIQTELQLIATSLCLTILVALQIQRKYKCQSDAECDQLAYVQQGENELLHPTRVDCRNRNPAS